MDMPSGYEPFLKECFSYTNRMSAINLLQLDWFDPVVTDVTVDSNSKTTQCMIAPSKSGYDNHDNRISESLTLEIRESIESANVLVHCIRDTMDEFKELDIEDAVGGSDTTITTGDHGNKGKSDFKKIQHIKKCRIM